MSKKTLCVVGHPNFQHSKINSTIAKMIATKGIDLHILSDVHSNYQFDVTAEQATITAYEKIVFLFPLYWYSVPSLLKKWIEDVCQYGWAYGDTFALEGKEIVFCVTNGANRNKYDAPGKNIEAFLLPLQETMLYMKMTNLRIANIYSHEIEDRNVVEDKLARILSE